MEVYAMSPKVSETQPCVLAQAYQIAKLQMCVHVCLSVMQWRQDIALESMRGGVLGDGCEVHQAEWKLSMPHKNCYGTYDSHSVSVSVDVIFCICPVLQKIKK